jgi:hypothetical protein
LSKYFVWRLYGKCIELDEKAGVYNEENLSKHPEIGLLKRLWW